MIGGDPEDLRQHATTLRAWADSVDDESAQLRKGGAVDWKSTAGDSFRGLVETDVQLIGTAAGHLRDAAERFDHLADTLQERQQWLEEAKQKIEDGIETAEHLVESGAKKVWDGAGSVVHGLTGLL